MGAIGHFGGSGKSGVSGYRRLGILGRFWPVRLTNKPSIRGSADAAAKNYVRIGVLPARPKIFTEIATAQYLSTVWQK